MFTFVCRYKSNNIYFIGLAFICCKRNIIIIIIVKSCSRINFPEYVFIEGGVPSPPHGTIYSSDKTCASLLFKSLASLIDFICCFVLSLTQRMAAYDEEQHSDLAAYLLADVHIYPNMETNLTNTLTSHQLRGISHVPDLTGLFAMC